MPHVKANLKTVHCSAIFGISAKIFAHRSVHALHVYSVQINNYSTYNILMCSVFEEKENKYILFYSILFYSILFYSILFYSILFYSILFYSDK